MGTVDINISIKGIKVSKQASRRASKQARFSVFSLKYHKHIETQVRSRQEIKILQYKTIPVAKPFSVTN